MIYTFNLPDGGMIATGEGGKKMINDAITKSIEELLTTLHNEPEEEVVKDGPFKWIDYDTYLFERNYQNELKFRYVNPLTPEECFKIIEYETKINLTRNTNG